MLEFYINGGGKMHHYNYDIQKENTYNILFDISRSIREMVEQNPREGKIDSVIKKMLDLVRAEVLPGEDAFFANRHIIVKLHDLKIAIEQKDQRVIWEKLSDLECSSIQLPNNVLFKINSTPNDGLNELALFITNGNREGAKSLMASLGININDLKTFGGKYGECSLLWVACFENNSEMVAFLLSEGADPNKMFKLPNAALGRIIKRPIKTSIEVYLYHTRRILFFLCRNGAILDLADPRFKAYLYDQFRADKFFPLFVFFIKTLLECYPEKSRRLINLCLNEFSLLEATCHKLKIAQYNSEPLEKRIAYTEFIKFLTTNGAVITDLDDLRQQEHEVYQDLKIIMNQQENEANKKEKEELATKLQTIREALWKQTQLDEGVKATKMLSDELKVLLKELAELESKWKESALKEVEQEKIAEAKHLAKLTEVFKKKEELLKLSEEKPQVREKLEKLCDKETLRRLQNVLDLRPKINYDTLSTLEDTFHLPSVINDIVIKYM